MRSSSTAARGRAASLVVLSLALLAIPALAQETQAPAEDEKGEAAGQAPASPADQTGDAESTPPATAPPADTDAGTTAPPPPATAGAEAAPATAPPAADAAADDEAPVNLRLRRLEQRVQALKERAWRAKARVGMLKEAVLGGGVGANATIVHVNEMGSSYRLIKLVYALDGTQIFARTDDGTGALHENENIEVLAGPIVPGSHTLSVLAIYRGNGYGVFKYLNKYKFTVRSSHTFTVTEGNATRIEAVAFERGGVTTPLEKRPAMDFKVSHSKDPGGS